MSRKARSWRKATRPSSSATREAKRERHAAAARARDRTRRRANRIGLARKAGIGLVVGGLVVVVAVIAFRRLGPRPIPKAALAAAEAAGCGPIQTPDDSPSGGHLSPGQTWGYTNELATSGLHDPSQLPSSTHIYDTPVPEVNAVLNLEHAYVLVYYRPDGQTALPGEVVDALSPVVTSQDKVIMAPFLSLPQGNSFALLAWNQLWSCPASITPGQAQAMTSGFIEVFRGTGNAPEPSAP